MSVQPEGDPALGELAKFANLITNPHQRREFNRDPLGTLAGNGVDTDQLPPSVREFLSDLSYEELRLLGKMQTAMTSGGMSVPTPYGTCTYL